MIMMMVMLMSLMLVVVVAVSMNARTIAQIAGFMMAVEVCTATCHFARSHEHGNDT